MDMATHIKIALLTLLLIVTAWADIPIAPPSEQSWKSGATTVTLSGGTLTIGGEGEEGSIRNYSMDTPPPWYDARLSITDVVIGKGVLGIGNYAFADCANLRTITVRGRSPLTICFYAFSGVNPNNVSLYVPRGSAYAYRNTMGWAKGWEIFDRVNGVSSRTADVIWIILAGFSIYGFASWTYLLLWIISKKIFRWENNIIKTLLKIISPVPCLVICGILIVEPWYVPKIMDSIYHNIIEFVFIGFVIYASASLMYRLLQFIFKKIYRGENKYVKIPFKVFSSIICLITCVVAMCGLAIMMSNRYWSDKFILYMIFLGLFFCGLAPCIYRLSSFILKKIGRGKFTVTKGTLMGITPFLSLAVFLIGFWMLDTHRYYFYDTFDAVNRVLGNVINSIMIEYGFFFIGVSLTVAMSLYLSYRHYLRKTIKRPTATIILTACHVVFFAALFIAGGI
jgi:hypothetical protein